MPSVLLPRTPSCAVPGATSPAGIAPARAPRRPDRLGLRGLAALVVAASLSACAPDAPAPDSLAITNVTVIDAAEGLRAGQTVVVEGDRIVSVGPGPTEVRAARVIDGSGRYLIPGLWDMHVHLTYDTAWTRAMPRLFLSWGITSVRDTGGLLEKILPVVAWMRSDTAVAPRVFFGGPLLDGRFVVYDGSGRPEIGIANPTPEEARANVAALAEAGVDFIKVYEMVSPEVFDALVAAASEHGLPIASHVPLSMRASVAGPRVRSMEHLRNVELDCARDAEALQAERVRIMSEYTGDGGAGLRSRLHRLQRLPAVAAEDPQRCAGVIEALRSTIQVPTLRLNAISLRSPFEQPDWMDALERAPGAVAEAWREATLRARDEGVRRDTTFGAWSLRMVGRMHRAGVPIGAGTDTPIAYSLPGYALHEELALLVRAGLPPLEALRAATLRPAEFLGLDGEMGRIAPGQRADLVLLSANPLDDILNTRAIEAVVSRRRWFTPEELAGR